MLETVTEPAPLFDEVTPVDQVEVPNELPPLVRTSVLKRNRTDFPVWNTSEFRTGALLPAKKKKFVKQTEINN